MKNVKDLLEREELAMVKGGKMEAFSFQLAAAEMGKESCCNVTIIIGKEEAK